MKLFLTAFLQVFFVSANTWFIARGLYAGVAVCGFAISWLWTSNVKRIAVSGTADRLRYATGAMVGGLVGLALASLWSI